MGSKASDGKWEKKLNIITAALDYEKEDSDHSRYEPTSYAVLERLASGGYIRRNDVLVDYGCGKGRVGFFMNYTVGCRTIGVEYNEALCARANENLAGYTGRRGEERQVSFVCESAENYRVEDVNRFYFFNPFSERLLQTVLRRILESYYGNPREMLLFFYYPTDSYLSLLMTETELQYAGEIDCRDLFPNEDPREKILVFRIE